MAALAVRAEGLEGSARRRAYDLALRLRRAEEELAQARERADEAHGAQRALLSGLNHELRTPLNAITGFAGLLKETGDIAVPAEKRDEYLEHILHSASILLERIDAILAAANKGVAEEEANAGPEAADVAALEQPEPEPEPQPTGGHVATVVKGLIRDFHGRLFVTEVILDHELPMSRLSNEEIGDYLHSLFSLIARNGRVPQSIGVRLKSSTHADESLIVLELLLPRGTDQPTHDELKQIHLGESTSMIAIETFRPPDGRMMLRLNIPTLHQDS
ncbi:MAG: histidine kinase dimerization/phospho-acceptor domain-containing protein [Pseudomonadota bacterium]